MRILHERRAADPDASTLCGRGSLEAYSSLHVKQAGALEGYAPARGPDRAYPSHQRRRRGAA
jgi:hypothetical protein